MTTAVEAAGGSLKTAIESMRDGGFTRLRPIPPSGMNPLSAVVAKYHIGDPVSADDAWRPWIRRKALRQELAGFHYQPDEAKLAPEH